MSVRSKVIAASRELSLKQTKLRKAVQLMLAESGGPSSAAEKAEARKQLGLPKR